MQRYTLPFYLAAQEILRNRSRFLSVSMVTALITILVLFIAGLGEGLGNGNREYLSKLDAQLIAFQEKSDQVISASRMPRARLNAIRRVEGVADVGAIATSNAAIINLPNGDELLKTALVGVEPGRPGEPKVLQGAQLSSDQAKEVILERNAALRSGFQVGDTLTIRVTQGTRDEFYDLKVVGISDGQQLFLQPTLFVPLYTWDRVRPKSEAEIGRSDTVVNIAAIRLSDPAQSEAVSLRLLAEVDQIELGTLQQTIAALPGYTAQQSTIQTQGVFTLLIGLLVIGGFFQIQTLQKVAQIGVLKAIGAPNGLVAMASVLQIVLVTTIGVALGGLGVFLLKLGFPPTIPIVFNGPSVVVAILALLLIGPIGGLVSVRYAVRIEPLKALGLGG